MSQVLYLVKIECQIEVAGRTFDASHPAGALRAEEVADHVVAGIEAARKLTSYGSAAVYVTRGDKKVSAFWMEWDATSVQWWDAASGATLVWRDMEELRRWLKDAERGGVRLMARAAEVLDA